MKAGSYQPRGTAFEVFASWVFFIFSVPSLLLGIDSFTNADVLPGLFCVLLGIAFFSIGFAGDIHRKEFRLGAEGELLRRSLLVSFPITKFEKCLNNPAFVVVTEQPLRGGRNFVVKIMGGSESVEVYSFEASDQAVEAGRTASERLSLPLQVALSRDPESEIDS